MNKCGSIHFAFAMNSWGAGRGRSEGTRRYGFFASILLRTWSIASMAKGWTSPTRWKGLARWARLAPMIVTVRGGGWHRGGPKHLELSVCFEKIKVETHFLVTISCLHWINSLYHSIIFFRSVSSSGHTPFRNTKHWVSSGHLEKIILNFQQLDNKKLTCDHFSWLLASFSDCNSIHNHPPLLLSTRFQNTTLFRNRRDSLVYQRKRKCRPSRRKTRKMWFPSPTTTSR